MDWRSGKVYMGRERKSYVNEKLKVFLSNEIPFIPSILILYIFFKIKTATCDHLMVFLWSSSFWSNSSSFCHVVLVPSDATQYLLYVSEMVDS